ncbi:hypothetical protein EPO05_00825 [Patescibacteria group bacterium]|nr:MAG: hypothetical protein EPO05_00825 [Patescibacteria group bacterium]
MTTISQKYSFSAAIKELLSAFPERSQQIVEYRYGIGDGGVSTLDEIGKEFRITRERVRQIISEVIRKLKRGKSNPTIVEAEKKIVYAIGEKNGILKKDELLNVLCGADPGERSAVTFLLDVIDSVSVLNVKGEVEGSVSVRAFDIERWREVKKAAVAVFESLKQTLTGDELVRRMTQSGRLAISTKELLDFLAVSTEVKLNQFGKWGLAQWPEISPRGTREKAYLVLKEAGKPLYFREIAGRIDEFKLNRKSTNPQTVHNELIKDERFVLIGRGIYALAEWGYRKGTVKELIEEILREKQAPMQREEILKKVLERRQVKKSTIVINLNNFFQRVKKDEYTLKNA